MLQVHHLHKTYGVQTILDDVSLTINPGERVGLIGPNGAGKSTLLRCIIGEEQPDSGTVARVPAQLSLGYLPQTLESFGERTLGEVLQEAQAELVEAERAMQRAAERLAVAPDVDAALRDYERATARFEALGGYEREQRAAEILERLGLGALAETTPIGRLSGGQKTRLGLAALLLSAPELLLLDEPTNHLDVEALEWLERFVREYHGAVLVVSHDREFLDQTVERVLYLDPRSHGLRGYSGGYSDFAAAREHEHELHAEAWRRQQEYVERTERDIARLRGEAQRIEGNPPPRQPGLLNITRRLGQAAKTRERKLERYLASDERVDKPRGSWGLKLDFGPPPPGGRSVLRLDELRFAYPNGPLLIDDLSLEVQHGERIAIRGPNGAGKTTLLRLITGQLEPCSGTIRLGTNVRLGLLAQEHETLDPGRSVLETALRERAMSETEARSFLHFFLFQGDAVFQRVAECSLGQRSRLQLALLVLRGCNLLLLDEPLNHLDIEGRRHFEQALAAFEGTVIAVAHDRAFLRTFADRYLDLKPADRRG